MTNELQLILTRGLPASGKSTWAEKELIKNPDFIRVERDLLRDQLFGHRDYAKLTAENENTVTAIQRAMAVAAWKIGKSVIVSDTNLRAKFVREWAKLAAKYNVNFSLRVFEENLDELLIRNSMREHFIDEKVIHSMWNKFTKDGKIADIDVTKELGNSWNIEPYTNPENLSSAIVVDIDGTLATMKNRSPYEWHRVGEDEPVKAVIDAVKAARAFGDSIIIMSGRDGSCRSITENWLKEHVGFYDAFYMRTEGDMRKDDLVKYELFNTYIRDKFHVKYILDDRDQVIAMWRDLGLAAFQVNYGDF
jgi:predicted kinase